MSVAAFLLAFGGFAALAMAMSRHSEALTGRALPRRIAMGLKGCAWGLLGGSLWASMAWLGNPVGLVAWFGLLNGAALLTALCLTLARRWRA